MGPFLYKQFFGKKTQYWKILSNPESIFLDATFFLQYVSDTPKKIKRVQASKSSNYRQKK